MQLKMHLSDILHIIVRVAWEHADLPLERMTVLVPLGVSPVRFDREALDDFDGTEWVARCCGRHAPG